MEKLSNKELKDLPPELNEAFQIKMNNTPPNNDKIPPSFKFKKYVEQKKKFSEVSLKYSN